MGLFTPSDRERAEDLAEQAATQPADAVAGVFEHDLLRADDAAARRAAARALADAAEQDPGAVAPHVDAVVAALDDEADVRSHAERALRAVAAHHRERGEAALATAADHVDDGNPDRARDALASARDRFERAEAVFADAPDPDVVLDATVGVETVDPDGNPQLTPLARTGSDLPAEGTWEFTTGTDGQQMVRMRIRTTPETVRSPRPLADGDEVVAQLTLANLPPAPAGVPVLEVGVDVDEDGAVTAWLADHGSGNRVEEPAGTLAVTKEGGVEPGDAAVDDDLRARIDAVAERIDALETASAAAEAVPPPAEEDGGSGDDDADVTADTGPSADATAAPDPDAAATEAAAGTADTDSTGGDAASDVGSGGRVDAGIGDGSEGRVDAGDDAGVDDGAGGGEGDDDVAGPGRGGSPVARGARVSSGDEVGEGPSERAVELLLDVRDDLKRALDAETDDPSVIRKGVEMTGRKLDRFEGDDGTAAPVRESLSAVLDGGADTADTVRERARAARDRVDEVLADVGVEVIDPDAGATSDADRHRVVDTEQSDRPGGRVVDVEQSGFERDGTVRRPAKVRVSAGEPDHGADERADPAGTGAGGDEDAAEPMPAPGETATADAGEGGEGLADTQTDGDTPGEGRDDDSDGGDCAAEAGDDDAGTGDGARVPETVPGGPTAALSHDDLTGRAVLGRGESGEVYRATVGDDGPTVAVTEPDLAPVDAAVHDRFETAVERWARLDDHDHVVDVVDWGVEPVPWVATEFADGGSLADRAGEMGLRQATWTAVRVADAVLAAHRQGLGHFDLKPADVLFRSVEGAWDVPKVGNWALARLLLDRADTVTGSSPRYAAPEQLGDEHGTPGPPADVYAVGAIAYELVTGEPPYTGRLDRVVEKVRQGDPTPPSALNPDVTPALEDAILTAMATDPGDRQEDVLALRDALRAALDDR